LRGRSATQARNWIMIRLGCSDIMASVMARAAAR
jgi:hypothetical protein